MDVRIVVASQSFGSRYQGLVYAQLKRARQPGESIEECAISRPREPAFLHRGMLDSLAGPTRPTAVIGISLRPDAESVAALRAAGVPVVLIDEHVEGASTVACDHHAGGLLAGHHLGRAGRRSIAVVSGPAGDYNAAQRLSGFRKALSEHHLSLPPEAVLEAPAYARTDGEAAMSRLLREGPATDAVFVAAGDTCALGLLSVAREARLRIPEQLAVIGYDDIPLASIAEPPLTTIRQPLDAIAREAWRLAARCAAEILERPKRSLIEPELVTRMSA